MHCVLFQKQNMEETRYLLWGIYQYTLVFKF